MSVVNDKIQCHIIIIITIIININKQLPTGAVIFHDVWITKLLELHKTIHCT